MATAGDDRILEHGDIYFFYRPKVEQHRPRGEEDVERFYLVLSPRGKNIYREIVIGKKALPRVSGAGERHWGFVNLVTRDSGRLREELRGMEYRTRTRGERELPPVRPAGEGIYAIVRHGSHTHLAYSLELPERPREVQKEFNIADEASYIISIKNPEKPSPPRLGLKPDQKPDYPKRLLDAFRERRFADADPPEFLDFEGTEIMLIGAREDPGRELGVELQAERETESSADIFRNLRLDRREHPVKPLFEGKWE